MRMRILFGLVGVAVVLSLVAAVFEKGPIHAFRCQLEGRDGWTIEFTPDVRIPEQVEALVREETTCVQIKIEFVAWNEVPEGELALPVCCRRWFGLEDSVVLLLVEGDAEQAAGFDYPFPVGSVAP